MLTQARDDLIERTLSPPGREKAIVHYYNACAPSFRKIVFNQDKAGVKAIAVAAGKTIKRLAAAPETQWGFEYSPEVFSSTETDFAVEVCNAVIACSAHPGQSADPQFAGDHRVRHAEQLRRPD